MTFKTSDKIVDIQWLSGLRKNPEKKIVHCHGVFDVLHAGHLAYFQSAKKFGDTLVVTLTTDEYVNKGPGRPYFNATIRASMLAALEVVDYVAVSKFPTAVEAIEAVQPHFYVKGPDYRDRSSDPTGNIFREEKAVEKSGGKLVFTGDETFSSSSLINMFFPVWNDAQQAAIDRIKALGGLGLVEDTLNRVAQEEVLIVGEPIVDTYVFCKPEAISSKSPSISAKFLYQEDYTGGSLAIANHLADFTKKTRLLITHGEEAYFQKLLHASMDSRVEIHSEVIPDCPTPRKTRFIADDKVQRLFEMTDLRSDQWLNHSPRAFTEKLLRLGGSASCKIIADFGHGMFEGDVLAAIRDLPGFVGLNVQTNSSNFGFNPFTKHSKFSFLSIDLKEARVAYHDRYSSNVDLIRKMSADERLKAAAFSMTLGPNGSYLVAGTPRNEVLMPAFANGVVDALGAGDAFFAMTTMLLKVGAPLELVPFLGNVFAGLKTKIIGNKTSVTRAQLVKAVTAILK